MNKKYWILLFSLLILGLGSIIYFNFGTVYCPKTNKAYSRWFPYAKNDVLVFKNPISTKQLKVADLIISYTKSYKKSLKCGCCEDDMFISLKGLEDTIYIRFSNLNNPYSCMGSSLDVQKNKGDLKMQYMPNPLQKKSDRIILEGLQIEKNIGIKMIKLNGKLWVLDRIIKKEDIPKVDISYSKC